MERYWLFACVVILIPTALSAHNSQWADMFMGLAVSYNWLLTFFAARRIRIEEERLTYMYKNPSEFIDVAR